MSVVSICKVLFNFHFSALTHASCWPIKSKDNVSKQFCRHILATRVTAGISWRYETSLILSHSNKTNLQQTTSKKARQIERKTQSNALSCKLLPLLYIEILVKVVCRQPYTTLPNHHTYVNNQVRWLNPVYKANYGLFFTCKFWF